MNYLEHIDPMIAVVVILIRSKSLTSKSPSLII